MKFDKNYMKINLDITPEVARIHAHICGDGSSYNTQWKRSQKELDRHKRINIYRKDHAMEYYNKCPEVLEEFKKDFKIAFNRNISTNKNKIVVKGSKWIAEKLNLINKNSYNWFIPEFITNSSDEIVCSWIGTFFDDEAYIHPSRKRILVKCMNKSGLIQISGLLDKLPIRNKVNGPNCDKSYYLVIYEDGLIAYQQNIGFLMKRKADLLDKIIKMGTEEISEKP